MQVQAKQRLLIYIPGEDVKPSAAFLKAVEVEARGKKVTRKKVRKTTLHKPGAAIYYSGWSGYSFWW